MAEYLLKGGKMLAKTCKECGSPLFEYKGETGCVVCEYSKQDGLKNQGTGESPIEEKKPEAGQNIRISTTPGWEGSLDEEFALTIASLLRQARVENDAGKVIKLMKAVKIAAEAYATISH